MAEPMKNQYGPEVPRTIARMVHAVHPGFEVKPFLRDALDGYESLELMPRARYIARALHRHLPADYPEAAEIQIQSLGVRLERTRDHGLGPFIYLPHVLFVAQYGLEHFDVSMRAQYELTQRFTAEFSIRPFLVRYPEETLERLRQWAADPNPHVRRLVSEGTRPRLPWASRLRAFQVDPRPVLGLLELLKDDPELYVRRSVANNLNDIGKDHPDLLVETARRWLVDADENRRWIIRHALRSAVKRADPGALQVLGFGRPGRVAVENPCITPKRARPGGSVTIAFDLVNPSARPLRIMADFQVHYVKANARTNAKVFKLKQVELGPCARVRLSKTISLAEMTTRKHYAGVHRVDAVLNGSVVELGSFVLTG